MHGAGLQFNAAVLAGFMKVFRNVSPPVISEATRRQRFWTFFCSWQAIPKQFRRRMPGRLSRVEKRVAGVAGVVRERS